MRTVAILIGIVAILCNNIESAKILGVFHVSSYSHFNPPNQLMRALAEKGHEVTVISLYAPKNEIKNYRNITYKATPTVFNDNKTTLFDAIGTLSITSYIHFLSNIGTDLTENLLRSKEVQNLLLSNETFDLVIHTQFMSDAFKGFCHHYKAPCVVYTPMMSNSYIDPLVGNPTPLSYIADFYVRLPERMNFFERLSNTFYYLYMQFNLHFIVYPKHEQLMQKYFPNPPSKIKDVLYNNSLILLNSHPSFSYITPKLPNIIEIGGFHIEPTKVLPKELQKYLDESTNGVVFFSMGSMLKSSHFPKTKLQALLKTFGKLNLNVLWKYEHDLQDIPDNVKILNWIPQQDVLAHPNVKLFITHGGLFSTIEAIYFGVPILGIPIFADQTSNMITSTSRGFALTVRFEDLSENTLTNSIEKLLTEPRKNAKKLSTLLRDQPIKPMAKAIYWLEYVIRNRGASHFRSTALDLAWYQYFLLDVILFGIFIGMFSLMILIKCVKFVCCRSEKHHKKTKTN